MRKSKARQLSLDERVNPSSCALVIVDVQNYFCHAKGRHGLAGADLGMMPAMAENLTALVAAARLARTFIVWVRATYEELVQGAPLAEILGRDGTPPGRCLEGSWEADWFGGLEPDDAPNEVVVTKHRYSAFWDTEIDLYLRSNGVESVVVCGVVTSGCVESTARDAFFLNYRVVLPADASASYSRTRHDNALAKLALTFATVVQSAAVVAAWGQAPGGLRHWELEAKQQSVPDGDAIVDPARTALLIIDMQNDFCHPEGLMGRLGEGLTHNRSIIPVISGLVGAARAAGILVVHVRGNYGVTSGSSATLYRMGPATVSHQICLPGSWGAAQIDELPEQPGEPVVIKHRLSAFRDTALELLLRSNWIRTVVVVGTATQACVESTVREANMRDYRVLVAEDAVACRDRMRPMHEASLEVMREYFATLISASDLMRIWQPEHQPEIGASHAAGA